MAGHTWNLFVIRWMFFILMTTFTILFTVTLVHLAIHFFNEALAAMATFAGAHLVIIIVLSPILGVCMTADAITGIMWLNGCVHFIVW